MHRGLRPHGKTDLRPARGLLLPGEDRDAGRGTQGDHNHSADCGAFFMSAMSIRPSVGAAEYPALAAIWRGAVDATHGFLAAADRDEIEARLQSDFFPAVLLCVAEEDGRAVGFAGILGDKLEMLFVEAARRAGGIGTALLNHAITEYGVRRVDVNEQNALAAGFYTHHRFEVVGRSETDEAGRPYPLLHLRLSALPCLPARP
jgi:putative acetyltransferase